MTSRAIPIFAFHRVGPRADCRFTVPPEILERRSCRTLLVDADWRNTDGGYIAEGGKVKGFSNFATGQSPLEECIVRDKETENLYVMTTGDLKFNVLEFLSSEVISTALEKLREAFERIIIDGPPALAVSDAILLGRRWMGSSWW